MFEFLGLIDPRYASHLPKIILLSCDRFPGGLRFGLAHGTGAAWAPFVRVHACQGDQIVRSISCWKIDRAIRAFAVGAEPDWVGTS